MVGDMIERVARIICRAHFARRPHVGACTQSERLDHQEAKYWRTFEPAARAVLPAMRDPLLAWIDHQIEHGYAPDGYAVDMTEEYAMGRRAAFEATKRAMLREEGA